MHFSHTISPSSAIASGALPKNCVVRTGNSTLIYCLRLISALDLLYTLAFKVVIEGFRLKTPSIQAENLTVLTRLLDIFFFDMVCYYIYTRL